MYFLKFQSQALKQITVYAITITLTFKSLCQIADYTDYELSQGDCYYSENKGKLESKGI